MNSPRETIEFTNIMNRLAAKYRVLPGIAATVAVNFFKERFVQQNWIDARTQPWKKRKSEKDRGRAVLVKTARLKRDVQKIYVGDTYAIVGTTRLTAPYAKAHNEGFKGTVTVNAHRRNRYKKVKETYITKKGNQRTRTSKQVDQVTGPIQVGTHRRKMNIPQRRFMGPSPVLDNRIERQIAAELIRAITGK